MDLTNRLHLVIAGIAMILTLASAGLMIFRNRLPEKERDEIIIRTKSWWVICLLFFGSLLGGVDATLVLFCLCSYLGFKEFITLVPSRKADRRALFWAYLSIPFQYYWIHTTWYVMFLIFIPVYAFVVIATRLVIAGETERFIRAVSTIQWGLLATTYAVSHLAYMDTFPPQGNGSNGPTMVVFVVLITELNDIFQFVWGKALGKTRISPKVSPGKTWEGFLGGLFSTAIVSAILGPWLTPLTLLMASWIGAVLAIAGFFGDLTMSAVKRDLGIKDTGDIIPGHGGILDRIDSLVFTAPLGFHLIRFFSGF